MKKSFDLRGCWTALVTPFRKDGSLDEPALQRLIRLQIEGGVSGIVACGSTGEAATLTHEEYRHVIQIAREESRGKIPVMAGVSTNATWKAQEIARECEDLGADALLVLTPYYNKPTQEGIFEHFKAVSRSTHLPIVIYNIPGRTAINALPKTIARLSKSCSNIVGVKEASGSVDQSSEIVALAKPGFSVLSGDDSLTLPILSVGGRGVVSVVSNLSPKKTQRLCDAFQTGKTAQATALHQELFPLIKTLFVETNPIPVKAALSMMGLCANELRLPLTPLSTAQRPKIKAALKAAGLL